jgi:hypothetical protein
MTTRRTQAVVCQRCHQVRWTSQGTPYTCPRCQAVLDEAKSRLEGPDNTNTAGDPSNAPS